MTQLGAVIQRATPLSPHRYLDASCRAVGSAARKKTSTITAGCMGMRTSSRSSSDERVVLPLMLASVLWAATRPTKRRSEREKNAARGAYR